jgi:hypothetical protein
LRWCVGHFVHLPLRNLVLRERPTKFSELLRRAPARARLCSFVSVSAVRRSAALPVAVLDGPVGAAQQQLGDGLRSAAVNGLVQRRVPAWQTDGGGDSAAALRRFAASGNERRASSGCSSGWSGRSRRRRMRRAIGRFGDCRISPQCAARCGHRCARRGRGEGVGPHGGNPVFDRYPNTKQQARPEGRPRFRFGASVNGKEYSEGSECSPSRSRLAHSPNVRNLRKRSRRRRREIGRLGKTAGERTSHGTWCPDRH